MDYHILNCGAGVQSTTVALLVEDGEIVLPTETGKFDYAVFADTGDEPDDVYEHLEWLKKNISYPLVEVRRSEESLSDRLMSRDGERCVSIPAFTETGIVRRQCTSEYKIVAIEKWIRSNMLGLKPRQRFRKNETVVQYFGFSTDEPDRAARTKSRFKTIGWGEVRFPLFDEEIWMSRGDCANYLRGRVPHEVPRSACVYCPFKSNSEWRRLKRDDPAGWRKALAVDDALRDCETNAARGMEQLMFLHNSRVPLAQANLDESQKELFDMDCEGGCGL